MGEMQFLEEGIISPKGFRATGISCGLKNGGSKDISLLLSSKLCNVAMAFTKNRIQGAHIVVDKERIGKQCQAIIINSGNANCITGQVGIENAHTMVDTAEELLKISKGSCLVASTGVIGRQLNMTRIKYGIERITNLIPNETNIRYFYSGIATSDTRQKNIAYRFKLNDNEEVTIGVSAKGESMLKPWIETMHGTLLVFITTDADISALLMQKALSHTIENSFNRMSVDNDMSPNDSVFFLANGEAKNEPIIDEKDPRFEVFVEVLQKILIDTTKQLIKQGLGTTKLINLHINNAANSEQAEKLVRSIAESYQVKSGFLGQRSSWHKIINVVSYSGVDFDLETLKVTLNNHTVFEKGTPNTSYIASSQGDLSSIECTLTIDLQQGDAHSMLWTCDLTHDYLKVNSVLSEY